MMQTVELSYPLQSELISNLLSGAHPFVMAIGDFDGVHLGHQEVIKRAVQTGAQLMLPSAIMTFDPHPRQVMGNVRYEKVLSPLPVKLELLKQLGVDMTFVVRFDEDLMKVTPEEFVGQMLQPLGINTVFVGFDFTFGYRGAGTPDTLCELAHGRFAVEVVRPFYRNGLKVSSTQVRELLASGEMAEVSQLLGRPYSIRGTVIHGDARGRTIGFPTANVDVTEPYITPATGVYAVRVLLPDGRAFGGVMNIGYKPTFVTNLPRPTFEAHLFDYEGDLYGVELTVECLEYIRPERKFSSIDELVAQIQNDAQQARELFSSHR
jgi:riboflavin kinase / FMN adenylyltransferase